MKELEQRIGYTYRQISILENALTHSSFANESRTGAKSNERLEFLGDAVLSIIVSDHIYRNCPNLPEGDLSKLRALLVCEKSLCRFAQELGLGEYLRMSRGERNLDGQHRPSILADAFEAVIASIYLDGGLEEARAFVLRFVEPELKSPRPKAFKDYKTTLQEIVQKNPEERLTYVLVGEEGPDHAKHFIVEVHLNNNVIGKGGGRSKKEAEQQAAREALKLMGY